MLIIINPKAAGGTALRKWRNIGAAILPTTTAVVADGGSMAGLIGDALGCGEDTFIAAGGDGTVNVLVNGLLPLMTEELRQRVYIGAIGLGSSNDFHKPFQTTVGGIPVKIDRGRASRRDVGQLTITHEGRTVQRHFLVNASIGATASSNALFNAPDRILAFLKRLHTPSAILYTAVRGILAYDNIPARIRCASAGEIRAEITNLSILKSPYLSGSLSFDGEASYGSGTLSVRLAHSMDKIELFRMLLTLMQHRPLEPAKTRAWTTREIAVSSAQPFDVEFDGEILQASAVRVSVLPQHLWVCS